MPTRAAPHAVHVATAPPTLTRMLQQHAMFVTLDTSRVFQLLNASLAWRVQVTTTPIRRHPACHAAPVSTLRREALAAQIVSQVRRTWTATRQRSAQHAMLDSSQQVQRQSAQFAQLDVRTSTLTLLQPVMNVQWEDTVHLAVPRVWAVPLAASMRILILQPCARFVRWASMLLATL